MLKKLVVCSILVYTQHNVLHVIGTVSDSGCNNVMFYVFLGTVSDCGCNSWLSRNCEVCKTNLWENWFTLD